MAVISERPSPTWSLTTGMPFPPDFAASLLIHNGQIEDIPLVPSTDKVVLSGGQALDGGPVLPGFRVTWASLFAPPPRPRRRGNHN